MVVATNIAGIFTMPFMLAAVVKGGSTGVALEPIPLLLSLVQSILVPLVIGIAARSFVPGSLPVLNILTIKRFVVRGVLKMQAFE